MNEKFELVSSYKPAGDQPEAIEKLVEGVKDGLASQVLLGVTGSGKTFTIANVIEKVNKPTLVIAHNKILAAQLCNELREFFPNNRVEFFVSYYDYYQPEAYIVSSDTYIEKDMSINDEIDKLRNSATSSLLERSDTIVVASVSCIYGLGNPEEYLKLQINLREGQKISREEIIRKLINIQYQRNEIDFKRTTFRAKGDSLEIFPASSSEHAIRVEFFGDEIDRICETDALTGRVVKELKQASIFPATHYAVGSERLNKALKQIQEDCDNEVKQFLENGKFIEAQRLKERTYYDIEMMKEVGYCSGIENYSRYFDGRNIGEPPFTLMDYFPNDYLTIIDESHMTIPQIRAMFNGDRARKTSLVDYGFRLKAAYDNRPLNFSEFNHKLGQTIYISATPAEYELEKSSQTVEQLIRPTGLLDPEIEVRKTENQIDEIIEEISNVVKTNGRVLITTLTKKMAESLTNFLSEKKIKVRYLHSEIDTLERIEIINGLRSGEFDVLVGINLLREGLDMPEVKRVIILDADKEGFLRSAGALIQTIGRAARNSEGKVIMFADSITPAMQKAISETNRRREIQLAFNKKHNITPKTIVKKIENTLQITKQAKQQKIRREEIPKEIETLKGLMNSAASRLDFETAIEIRNQISELK
ncbi:MAG: excinuclease ABC subunit UvrB, partial [Clostridia bacterium]|nr:excinuclease ABC subunit UvrB [Clostridia bacterium]